MLEQAEFGRRQIDIAAATRDAAIAAVEADIAGAQHVGHRIGIGTAENARTRAISSGTENGFTT
jgi:hypothetical protein